MCIQLNSWLLSLVIWLFFSHFLYSLCIEIYRNIVKLHRSSAVWIFLFFVCFFLRLRTENYDMFSFFKSVIETHWQCMFVMWIFFFCHSWKGIQLHPIRNKLINHWQCNRRVWKFILFILHWCLCFLFNIQLYQKSYNFWERENIKTVSQMH